MKSLSAEALLRFAASLKYEPVTTTVRGAEFMVRVLPDALEITPLSSGLPRRVPRATVERVIDAYWEVGSTQKRHYQSLPFCGSYLLALIERYNRS